MMTHKLLMSKAPVAAGGFDLEADIGWHSLFWAEGSTLDGASGYAFFIPNTAGRYIQTPDAARFDLTSDMAIVARLALQSWGAGDNYLVSKAGTANFAWGVGVKSTGRLFVTLSADGTETQYESTANPTHVGGATWVAVSWERSSGDIKFWTAPAADETPAWVQLGATVAGPTGALFTNAEPVEIGTYNEGTAGRAGGHQTWRNVRIYSGVGAHTTPDQGTPIADLRFGVPTVDSGTDAATVGADGQGNTWTAYGTTWDWRLVKWVNETGEVDARHSSSEGATIAFASSSLNGRLVVNSGGFFRSVGGFVSVPDYTAGVSVVVVARSSSGVNQTLTGGQGTVHSVGINSGAWFIEAGSVQSGGTADTDPHLFVARFDGSTGNDSLSLDGGSAIINADAGSNTLDGITIHNRQQFASPIWVGETAFVGIYEGDITTHAKYADFKTWVDDHYGITIA